MQCAVSLVRTALAVGVVLGIGGISGLALLAESSEHCLDGSLLCLSAASNALSANSADGVAFAEKFVQGNNNNYGGNFAKLELAHHFVEQNAFDKAAQQLTQALLVRPKMKICCH